MEQFIVDILAAIWIGALTVSGLLVAVDLIDFAIDARDQ